MLKAGAYFPTALLRIVASSCSLCGIGAACRVRAMLKPTALVHCDDMLRLAGCTQQLHRAEQYSLLSIDL